MDSDLKHKSDDSIITEIGMAELPLILQKLYYKYDGKYELIDIGNDCMFRFGNTNVGNVSYLATFIHFLYIQDNCIFIEGNVSWPSVIRESYLFYIICNDKRYDVKLRKADLEKKDETDTLYENRDTFNISIPLNEKDLNDIVFGYELVGIKANSGKINAMRFSPVADMLKNQYAFVDGWCIKIVKAHILIQKDNSDCCLHRMCEYAFCKSIKNAEIIALRKEYFQRKKKKVKPIWLFMDRLEKADDNAEAFFLYVNQQDALNVDTYFVLSKNSQDFKRIGKYGKVIDAMSKEHFLLLFLADYMFVSQLNGWIENPFIGWEEYFRDIYHNPKVVFLQHGVTKDDHSKWLRRYQQNLFGIVTSSLAEEKAFLGGNYDYKQEVIWNVGMPRFDLLYSDIPEYVLIIPTWRKNLMEQRYDEKMKTNRWKLKKGKDDATYIYKYKHLMNNKKFRKICEDAGLKIAFMPHPLMQDYSGLFDVPDGVITLPYNSRYRDIFAKSAVMITDYSSVAFDFAYLKKPIIYYQFDRENFFESHSYKKGYFDYDTMGFGPVVDDEKGVVRTLKKVLKGNFAEKYKKRIVAFFSHIDNDNCKRLYNTLMHCEQRDNYNKLINKLALRQMWGENGNSKKWERNRNRSEHME